jgi:predicted nucleic-acid-binding Zn-ribbon protein
MKIGVDDVAASFQQKGVSKDRACPECGNRDWIVNDRAGALNATDPDSGEIVLEQATQVVVVICKQCGFLRQFAAQILMYH